MNVREIINHWFPTGRIFLVISFIFSPGARDFFPGLWRKFTHGILVENAVNGVRIRNNKTAAVSVIAISRFFVATGNHPGSGIFKGLPEMDEVADIKTLPRTLKQTLKKCMHPAMCRIKL